MNIVISFLLKLAFTVVKDVFCDVKNVWYYTSFQSSDTLKSSNLKTKIMNAYFQHPLYNINLKENTYIINNDDCYIHHYNPLPKNWSEKFTRSYRRLPSNIAKWTYLPYLV